MVSLSAVLLANSNLGLQRSPQTKRAFRTGGKALHWAAHPCSALGCSSLHHIGPLIVQHQLLTLPLKCLAEGYAKAFGVAQEEEEGEEEGYLPEG